MSDRIIRVKQFLTTKFPKGIQVFNSRNLVGDYMENIYKADSIVIDWSEHWNYIEIFGVNSEEYQYICDTVGRGNWNGEYEGD